MKLLAYLAVVLMSAPVLAIPMNVALGKPVSLFGTFGNSTAGTPIVWADPAPGPAALVTDGVFNPAQSNWQVDSVWWHEYDTLPPRSIEIDLLGHFVIEGAIVQADNNETYLLEYLDLADMWQPLWTVPAIFTTGVETRPNPLDNSEIFNFAPVTAKALRIAAGVGGDRYYAVTEVQVFGTAVPEPMSLSLALLGLAGLGVVRGRGARR